MKSAYLYRKLPIHTMFIKCLVLCCLLASPGLCVENFFEQFNLPIPTSSEGYLKGWMVLGPFSADRSPKFSELKLDSEKTVPFVGQGVLDRKWAYLPTNEQGRLNLQVLGGGTDLSVFAACIVDAKKATDAQLLLGSDDGARVWIDGELVHESTGPRSLQLDQDRIPIRLPDKPVLLLIQVLQGNGDWLLAARVVDKDGERLDADYFCPVQSDNNASIIPAWNGETNELTLHIWTLSRIPEATVKIVLPERPAIDEPIEFEELGQLVSRSFSLPWAAALTDLVKIPIELVGSREVLASTVIELSPTFIPNRQWLDAASQQDDVWRLTRKVGSHPKLADAFLGNGFFGIRLAPCGTTASYDRSRTEISGIYANGERILHPRWANVDLLAAGKSYRPVMKQDNYCQTLDMRRGCLTTEDTWATPAANIRLSIEVIPHRTRRNLLMMRYKFLADNDCEVELTDILDVSHIPDITHVEMEVKECASIRYQNKGIQLSEVVASQWNLPEGFKIRSSSNSDSIERRIRLQLPKEKEIVLERFAWIDAAIGPDSVSNNLSEILRQAISIGFDGLSEEHYEAWAQLWTSDILVPNNRLQQLIHSCLFNFYCNLREDYPWSIGPVGMSGGAWGGRVFWDADLWVFPPLAILQPKVARAIVEYRFNTLAGARHDAKAEDRGGAKWAWESARSGEERCPWPPAIEQRHIQNDVAYAQWIYSLCSGDKEYLRDKALPVISNSADYWCDRVEYNQESARYEILNVLGSDEYAENIDNNLTTNYGTKFTLLLAHKLSDHYKTPINPEWQKIAERIYLPFDESRQIYLQHDSYNGEEIKQADTSLAIYPWEMEMPLQVKKNILDYYPNRRPPTPIMMSAAIYSIAFSEIDERTRSEKYFNELIPYFWYPYLLASESENRLSAEAESQTICFATGMGGFLQAILNGFAGIRIHEDGLLIEPALPEWLPWIEIRGMHFAGEKLNCLINKNNVTISASKPVNFRVYNRQCQEYPVHVEQ